MKQVSAQEDVLLLLLLTAIICNSIHKLQVVEKNISLYTEGCSNLCSQITVIHLENN